MNTNEVRKTIENEFLRRKEKTARYSLRAYARYLSVDAGSLSRFLRGQNVFSEKALVKISLRLGSSSDELKVMFKKGDAHFLDDSSFEVCSQWYYLSILECFDLDNFASSPKWVANKLGLSVPVVQVAINQLIRIGLVEIDENGNWCRTHVQTSSCKNEDVDVIALRNLQKTHLGLAEQSIDFANPVTKSHSSLTTAIDSDLIPKIKLEIKKFRQKINKLAMKESNKKDSIYCLQLNWFETIERDGGKNVD